MEFKQLQISMNRIVDIISNNIDKKLKTSLGDNYIAENPFKIKFYYSTPIEFINIVGKEDTNEKLPFFFVNSMSATEKQDIWTVKDIVIATLSDINWTREKRDEINFRPILIPILQEFERWLMFDRDISIYKKGDTYFHYFYGETGLIGYDGQNFTQPVDAIQLKNFQIRMSKNCTKLIN